MKPIQLTMQAFGPYATTQTVNFEAVEQEGVFLLTGPTGAGKTSLFDGICFALYGESSGALRGPESLRSHHAAPDLLTEVVYTFGLRGGVYTVRRSPKQDRPRARGTGMTTFSGEAVLTCERQALTPIVGIREVNEAILDLLQVNADQFRQIIMIPQGEFRQLLVADSTDRQEILGKLFGTAHFERIAANLQREAQSLSEQLKSSLTAVKLIVEQLEDSEWLTAQGYRQQELVDVDGLLLELAAAIEAIHPLRSSGQLALESAHRAVSAAEQVLAAETQRHRDAASLLATEQERDALKASLPTIVEKEAQLARQSRNAQVLSAHERLIELKEQAKGELATAQRLAGELSAAAELIQDLEQQLALQSGSDLTAQRQKRAEGLARDEAALGLTLRLEEAQQVLEGIASTVEQQSDQLKNHLVALKSLGHDGPWESVDQESLEDLSMLAFKSWETWLVQETQAIALERQQMTREQGILESLQRDDKRLQMDWQRLKQTHEASLESAEAQQVALGHWRQAQRAYHLHQAAALAALLSPDMPCPVCGSLEHPAPATLPDRALEEGALESLEEAYRRSEQTATRLATELARDTDSWQEALGRLQAALGGPLMTLNSGEAEEPPVLETKLLLAQGAESLEALAQRLKARRLELQTAATALVERESYLSAIGGHFAAMEQRLTALDKASAERGIAAQMVQALEVQLLALGIDTSDAALDAQGLAARLDGHRTWLATYDQRLEQLRRELDQQRAQSEKLMALQAQNAKTAQETQASIDRVDKGLLELLHQLGMALEAVQADWLSPEAQAACAKETTQFRERLAGLEQSIQDLTKRVQHEPLQDLEALAEAVETAKTLRNVQSAHLNTLQRLADHYENQRQRLQTAQISYRDLAERYRVLGGLADTLRGKNPKNLSLERYVLTYFMDAILERANRRLLELTEGRYYLVRLEEAQRRGKQAGLELAVLDAYTGMQRHVKTLSGGESFKASLALALGLAEVVETFAGGVRLDTLMIDEGFGTLDPESLDTAINCLLSLRETGRLVGIISHVPELKERISAQIQIVPSMEGSSIKLRTLG